jgi:hypothetical protein
VTAIRIKTPLESPVFERMNRERLKRCEETAEAAKQTIATSKRLTQQARELIENLNRSGRKHVKKG